MLLIFILNFLWASTFIIGQDVVSVIPPVFFIGIRMILSGVLLLGYMRYAKKFIPHFNKAHYPWLAGIIFFHVYLAFVCEFIGLSYISGAKVSLLFNLSPFITALIAYFVFQDRMTSKQWLGMGIGFFGFIPILMADTHAEGVLDSFLHISWPELLVLVAVASGCIGWICMKKLTHNYGYPYIFVNGFGMFWGGLLCLGTSYSMESWPTVPFLLSNVVFWRSLILLILIGNVLAFNLYGKLLHTYSPTALSFFGFTTPFFAALLGWFFLGDCITIPFVLSFVFVSIGLYIYYQDELKLLA